MKINKLLVFIFIIALNSCTKETDCVEITRKEISGSNFLFFWQIENYDNVGLEAEPIPSGAVSEEIYNQYNVGDIYCVDN
tara:strand:+ start:87 stop:326 length:240 start_codon:yes stop_codon:yes gene_type:complete